MNIVGNSFFPIAPFRALLPHVRSSSRKAAIINKIKKAILSIESLHMLSEVFKAISDVTRLKIILALKDEELCVCDISHILGVSLSAVSHQLRILRNLRLVKYRSEGRMVFYSLADRRMINLIQEGIRHNKEG